MKSDWEYKMLRELCCKITDGSHNPPKGIGTSSYLMISSQNVYDDKLDLSDVRYLSKEDFDIENKRTKISEGDVLLTIVGTVGRSCVIPHGIGSIALQRSVAVMTPKNNIFSRFLMYCLRGKRASLQSESHGIAQKGIYLKQLSNIVIPVPPIKEQEEICFLLDKLSLVIEKKKEQVKQLDNLAQSIFYDMFGDPVENEKGWEVKKLGDVCTFSQGIQVGIEEQSTEPKRGWNRFLRIVDYTTENDDIRYVNVNEQKYWVGKDDIAMVRYGSVGVADIGKEGILANNLFKINYSKNLFEKYFLLHSFRSEYFWSYIGKSAFGATMPALSFRVMNDLLLLLPPLSLQQSFAQKVEAIERQKELINQSIREAQTLFDSRMEYYFGE